MAVPPPPNQPGRERIAGMKTASIVGLALMAVGLIVLLEERQILGRNPVAIAVQVVAVLLMVAARITFGRRSFHAAANPTGGGLVTTGPYRYLRHPIYAAILYFVWAAALDYHTAASASAAVVCTAGAVVRMLSEERLVVERYPEYRDYMRRTKRVLPFVL